MKATAKNIQAVSNEVMNNTKTRSAWDRGVKAYALDMLERFEEWRKWNESEGLECPELDERTALWCDANVKRKYNDIVSRYE